MLTEAIEAAYGTSYDVRWVYDPAEVAARLADWHLRLLRRRDAPTGELLCHEGMSLAAAGDAVAHSGQAVTLPAARGQHLFTRTKRFLMDWARSEGLAGHVQRGDRRPPLQPEANIELGAHETGFLLGWIPASVSNDAAGRSAAAAAVGGALLHEAERRPRAAASTRPSATARSSARRSTLCELRGHARRAAAGCRAGRAHRAARRGRRATTTWR